MVYVSTLPSAYRPFRELRLCSNALRGVSIPIAIDRFPILLVGQGPLPLVWLAAPVEPGVFPWPFVVSANRSSNPAVGVHFDLKKATVRVSVSGLDVLRVSKTSEESAEIAYLDLRPIGLDIIGTSSGLQAGGTHLVGNTLVDLEIGLAVGPPARATGAGA